MRQIKDLFTSVAIFAVALSCSKESAQESPFADREIQFYASYQQELSTKSTTLFTTGNRAQIFAYSSTHDPAGSSCIEGTPLIAVATQGGKLEPGSPLYLPKGLYDFYSISFNNSSVPSLNLSSGVSQPLSNGIDYLWASSKSIPEGGSVQFAYSHRAVKLTIEIEEGDGVENLQVATIKITPPLATATTTMELKSGNIVSSQALNNEKVSLEHYNNAANYIMLPITGAKLALEVSASLKIGEVEVESKLYEVEVPQRDYLSGTHYKLTFIAGANALEFIGSTVADWVVVDNLEEITLIER